MHHWPTIAAPAVAGLLALACAGAQPGPKPVIRVSPQAAVKHARGEQVGIVAREGTPNIVNFHTVSSVAQWVYCGDDQWARVFDFDSNGNLLVSLDLLNEGDFACTSLAGSSAIGRSSDGEPGPHGD